MEAAEKMQIMHLPMSPCMSLYLPNLPTSRYISQVEAAEKMQIMQWINAFQVSSK